MGTVGECAPQKSQPAYVSWGQTAKNSQRAHVDWTVAQIESVAETFDDLEMQLTNVRREINRKYFPENLPDIDTD
jgi:hypothetical protein